MLLRPARTEIRLRCLRQACSAYWLDGGKDCNSFRIDVAFDTDPLLYSFKFYHFGRKIIPKPKQTLYVGKHHNG